MSEDKIIWGVISQCHELLSEDFIREFQDRVNWECISKYQTLSEPFIREFRDKMWLGDILHFQKLSEECILK